MNPLLFPVFIWERLTWWSLWLNEDQTGRADVIGAGTTGLVVALAVVAYVQRDRLKPAFERVKLHPVATTVVVTPVAALVLVCLSKFATFIGATLTTVGLLIALDNNRKSHDREAKRFSRQGRAARAVLPLELSNILDYCEEVAEALKDIDLANPKRTIFPDPPNSSASTFKEVITSTDDPELTERVSQILAYIQNVEAYTEVVQKLFVMDKRNDVNHAKLRVALLHGLASSLFDYARNESEEVEPFTWQPVRVATWSMTLHHDPSFQEYFNHTMAIFPNPLDCLSFKKLESEE